MKQTGKNLLMLLLSCSLFSACNKELKDDVENLQKPIPSGIVILDETPVRVVKGNQFQVTFRVNPSGIELTKENVELDVRNSDTYFYFDKTDTKAQTRASYVTSSDYYELANIEPDKNTGGETLDGQWVATIQTKGEANFRNLANLLFIANYTDATGVARKVSSSAISVEIVPTVDEGTVFGYSKVQTIYSTDSAINPYILFVDINAYKNDKGDEWHYNREFITEIKTTVNKDELTADTTNVYSSYYISFTPQTENQKWKDLLENKVKKAISDTKVELIDFGNTSKSLDLPVTYCMNLIKLNIELSAAEVNKLYDSRKDYNLDLSGTLAEYGFSPDFYSELARKAIALSMDGKISDTFPVIFDENINLTDEKGLFKPIANLWVSGKATPGMELPEDEINTATITIASLPQELTQPNFLLINVGIALAIRIIE